MKHDETTIEEITRQAVDFERQCVEVNKLWPKRPRSTAHPLHRLSFADRRIIREGSIFSDRVEQFRKCGRAGRRLKIAILEVFPIWIRKMLDSR